MGTEARVGLLLGATACLMAVLVDWVIEELTAADPTDLPAEETSLPEADPIPV